PAGESGFLASRERERRLAGSGNFRSMPAMPQADLADLYRAIDVTVLPSLAEPQGMVMIESMAAGCVTITTRVGGIPETITDGVTGLLVDDPLDTDALYEKTAYVLEHLAEFASLRSAARAYAVANLDWSVSAARLEALYQSILA
ncbi:glycosyltransferase family 4 protein, partial [Acidiferrobacter sp.]|uniref:glycosyltransferase family 4 protein n=1 Tax=Acidiferrobacter sp. TaxID=1872107 RepID=UPI00260F879E